ncbi:oxidase [Erythrobacter longus]|uniref:Oxidase n=1 Tax=Erythrobacter longus TaxID=1044 RepID=A0A074M3G4_ERYLO|nr:DUF2474 domain-containing protein [Erythrobacter longus]KEO89121.1 oxidase [Erythrobacter longus]
MPRPDTKPQSPLWKRLAWMAAIWLASVTVLGVVAMIIRFWLKV